MAAPTHSVVAQNALDVTPIASIAPTAPTVAPTTPPTIRYICADVGEGLRTLPEASVHAVLTSPPYYGSGVRGRGAACLE